MGRFDRLLSPIQVGKVTMKNRLMTTSMSPGHGYIDSEGGPTQRFLNYLDERAAGQIALICQTVAPFDRGVKQEELHPLPYGYKDADIPHLTKMAEVVHKHGGLLVGQPWFVHDWRPGNEGELEKPWGPSEIVILKGMHPFTPMQKEHIEIFIKQYVNCAHIIKAAGFDGVEIMAGVGGVLNRFLSPATNNRTDEYGGSLENRIRLIKETTEAVRAEVGPDFLITCRWSPLDLVKSDIGEGHGIEESLQVAPLLEEYGIDMHNLAIGWHESSVPLTIKEIEDGHWTWVSEKIKTVAKKPVAQGYRNTDPYVMEQNLADGKVDIIGGLRYNLADPAFAKKLMEDRPEDINLCVCCCRCLDDVVSSGKPLTHCGVNPRLGEELEEPLYDPPAQKKKVMVVGSGISGMRAAITANAQGHDVTIYERGPRVGGCLTMSSIFNPLYERMLKRLRYELKQTPAIRVRLNTTADKALVQQERPDAVIIAVGGHPKPLDVPGVDGANVVQSHDLLGMLNGRPPKKPGVVNKVMYNCGALFLRFYYTPSFARFVTAVSPWPLRKRVAVVGGGLPGCELGTLLKDNRREVTIIEEKKKIGYDVGGSNRFHVTSGFKKAPNVTMEPLTEVRSVDKNGVTAVREDGSEFHVDADTVAVTLGFDQNLDLARQLEGVVEVYAVGDCENPSRMADATKSGYRAARSL